MATIPCNLPPSYPDELWYSRLTRYHRRSGNLRTCTTMRELGTKLLNVNHKIDLYNSCTAIINYYEARNDEEGYWKAIRENTLDPFTFRFYTVTKRREYYTSLLQPKRKTYDLIYRMESDVPALRYCPLCYQEDVQMYGESYWHRLHQIQAVTICPKHHCQILYANVPVKQRATHYLFCADEIACPVTDPTPMQHPEQLSVVRIMEQMLNMPYDVDKEESVDGIQKEVLEQRYMMPSKSSKQPLQFRRQDELRNDIIQKYGDYAKKIFTEKGKRIQLFNIICTRRMFTAERYALLMDFLGVSLQTATEKQTDIINNTKYIHRLREIANTNYTWNKKRAAEEIGLTSPQMQELAEILGIPRFWGPVPELVHEPHRSLVIAESTYDLIRKRSRELGTYNIEAYVLYAVQKEMGLFETAEKEKQVNQDK